MFRLNREDGERGGREIQNINRPSNSVRKIGTFQPSIPEGREGKRERERVAVVENRLLESEVAGRCLATHKQTLVTLDRPVQYLVVLFPIDE